MKDVGIDLSNGKPQFLSDDLAASSSLLVTMGCGEACPKRARLAARGLVARGSEGRKPIERVPEIRDDVNARVVKQLEQESWR